MESSKFVLEVGQVWSNPKKGYVAYVLDIFVVASNGNREVTLSETKPVKGEKFEAARLSYEEAIRLLKVNGLKLEKEKWSI